MRHEWILKTLNKRSQAQKNMYCMISFFWHSRAKQIHGDCIDHLLLHNKLGQNLSASSNKACIISTSVGHESRHSLAGCLWFRLFCKVVSRCWLGLQSSQGLTGDGLSVPKFTGVAVGRSQVVGGSWQKTLVPCHLGLSFIIGLSCSSWLPPELGLQLHVQETWWAKQKS